MHSTGRWLVVDVKNGPLGTPNVFQGWNSGMRDATNLGWKLSTVLKGVAGDALLDTYTSERRYHAKRWWTCRWPWARSSSWLTRSPSRPATLLLPR